MTAAEQEATPMPRMRHMSQRAAQHQHLPGEVFVFGSNRAGRHGKGAALDAVRLHGAVYGRGEGRQGASYAIPTKDARLQPLSLLAIEWHVAVFLEDARSQPNTRFFVTRVGCGLAGYTDQQIAPLFRHAPDNCRLPPGWRELAAQPPHGFVHTLVAEDT